MAKIASVQDLIKRREAVQNRKKTQYEFTTSIGTILVKKAPVHIITEAISMDNSDGDAYLLANVIVEPSMKDKELQGAYGASDPIDMVKRLFEVGEIATIAGNIMKLNGYGADLQVKIHDDLKKQ